MQMMKASVMTISLTRLTADSSDCKCPPLVQGSHSIGVPSAVSMFDASFKTVPLSIFPYKYAK